MCLRYDLDQSDLGTRDGRNDLTEGHSGQKEEARRSGPLFRPDKVVDD